MDADILANIIYATLRSGTPLLLCGIGVLIAEKCGVLNLGQEGMMLLAAASAFITTTETGSYAAGFAIGAAAGVISSLLFAIMTQFFYAPQVPVGLALTIIGTGGASFLASHYAGQTLAGLPALQLPWLQQLPIVGKGFFQHSIAVYLTILMAIVVHFILVKSHLRLRLSAVGENANIADKLGIKVFQIRLFATLTGGAFAGLAGAYIALAYSPLWAQNITGGRGWISLALVIFASWKLLRLALGAYLFGFASIMHLMLQSIGIDVSTNILAMSPYILTLVVLVFIAARNNSSIAQAPKALGQNFIPER